MDQSFGPHPYHPPTASIPSYRANETPLPRVLITFAAMVGAVTGLAYCQTSRLRLRAVDKWAAMWFALCYFLLHRATIPQQQTLFAQLWKEYALSDSRYLTLDVFTVCIEFITVVSFSDPRFLTLHYPQHYLVYSGRVFEMSQDMLDTWHSWHCDEQRYSVSKLFREDTPF
ncbi:hypothetical protein E4U57_007362 [Claviceps arundinis]|uniref:Uncharacterized protein n=1 Tax=Claviceps arundinis TaxID=1623583 RepID=A0A9P7SSC2_9HYPO|nr:hypothetical protein E4U57_007362 [Claviceps arundinis]KAG5978261.1 hypothetical protein E4U56_004604 [Claviceps arundinis]